MRRTARIAAIRFDAGPVAIRVRKLGIGSFGPQTPTEGVFLV